MRLVGIIAFNIHDQQAFGVVASQDDSSRGPVASLALQYCEAGLEEIVEQGALACVLGADDGHREVVLIAGSEGRDDLVQCLLAA